MAIKIVTDSTCDLDAETIKKYNINVIPLYVHLGVNSYREDVDIILDDFYEKAPEEEEPRTSHPTPEDFLNVYESLVAEGHSIISIHISSKLSQTCNSAKAALQLLKDDYSDTDITVIDSRTASCGLGLNVIKAAEMIDEGKSKEDICEELERIAKNNRLAIEVFDLSFMVKGGIVGRERAARAKLLSIFPVFTLENGFIVHHTSPVGKKAALKDIFDYFMKETENKPPELISTVCGTLPLEEEGLYNMIRREYPEKRIYRNRLGAVIGTHFGVKSIGITWF